MSTFTRFTLAIYASLFWCLSPVSGQNLALSTQNPTALYVCGVDQVSVTVQNAAGNPPATTLRLFPTFPNGVTYEPGTVVGATEFDITNLNMPVFSLIDLEGNATANISFKVKAGCPVVAAINSGQIFVNNFTVNYNGGSKQLTSNSYIIETGLANLISVTPNATTAMQGDVIMRTIKLKNTRQGPIHSLSFRDQHQSGINIELIGGINQNNAPTLFTGEIPGSFFMAFGDGDDLLEESDGEITIVEKVTITSCGIPSFTTKSDIIVGWGCGGSTCRSDSIVAQITILPSNLNPDLAFSASYARPISNCGAVPTPQEILITNNGQVAAFDVFVDVFTIDTSYMGFDLNSFEWSTDGVTWQSTGILNSFPTTLGACNLTDYKLDVVAIVPKVEPGQTVRLRFNYYFCQALCEGLYPSMAYAFTYDKACPSNVTTSGLKTLFPDTAFLKLENGFEFNIGHCLEADSSYILNYFVQSKRLLVDTGVLKINIQLPWGLEWDSTCILALGGQIPLSAQHTIDVNGTTFIEAVYDLPFTQDSVGMEVCIRYHCEPDLPCAASVPNVPPRGMNITAYPPEADCDGCELGIQATCAILLEADDPLECGITACEAFTMVVDDSCNDGGGGGIGIGSGDLVIQVGFEAWRVNRGLQDDNNDRLADSANPANAPNIRLDRFLTGDTLRNELQVTVLVGSLTGLNYRLFLESMITDFGVQDGDSYALVPKGKNIFVNYDSTKYVGGQFTIKKANGDIYSCPFSSPTERSDQHLIDIAQPNIRPPQIVDQVLSMFDEYLFNLGDYTGNGCLPQGLTIEAGDMISLQADYKFTNNFVPPGQSDPPLINFRTSVCDRGKVFSWQYDDFCTVKPLMQFSGYVERFTPAIQRLEPCDASTELRPFNYTLRVARENMFPFEVRPITSLFEFSHTLPVGVGILETKLNYLKLQEDVPLFSNENISSNSLGDSLTYNLSSFFGNPMDEGYSLEITTRYDTTCGYDTASFGRTNIGVRYADLCLHDPLLMRYAVPNSNSFLTGSPQLDFFNIGLNTVSIPTNSVELDFTIRNSSPVPATYSWIILESDNNLTDIELFMVTPPTLTPVPLVGGVYQLDTLKPFAQPFFKIRAKSISCGTFKLKIRYGWGCEPTVNTQTKSCGEFMGMVEIRPQAPELELIIVKEQASIPFCAPSEDFEFEIANANDGSAYNVVPTVKLPQGFKIVPGSSRLSFPVGVGALIPMPNPVQLPGNVWQFDPQAVAPLLVQNGLLSFEQEPLNAMRILFKIQADCGAVANAQPIYGAEAVQPCGISSNRLRKPGQPIGINGVNAMNSAVSNLSFANPTGTVGCGETVQLSASIQLDGPSSIGDSIYISLPNGTTYVTGSYSAGANAPAGPPKVLGQNLQLPLPTNLGVNAVLTFTFSIRYDDPAGCTDKYVVLQTREKTTAMCGNVTCAVYVASSEALLNLNAQNPELQLNNFQIQQSTGGQTTFSANLENLGTASASNPVVQLYHDINGNGIIDLGDPLVATVTQNGTITPGAMIGISGNLNLPSTAYCDLIALIPADENCACADKAFPLGGNQVVHTGIGLCNLQAVPVGTDSIPGNTYAWQTINGLSCTNCANAIYTPGPGVPPGALVTLVLFEQSGDCKIERRFDIQFGGAFGIETTEQTICQGRSATLVATPGGTMYSWVGPGISNVDQQVLIVTPNVNSLYSVTVTFADGCTGTGTTTVFVEPSSFTELQMSTCSGIPVQVFEDLLTDIAGVYTHTYTSVNGCDSVITVTLAVQILQKEEEFTICEGDSIVVNMQTFYTNAMTCETYTTANGCDSTYCATINVVPMLQTEEEIRICEGDSIVVNMQTFYTNATTCETYTTASGCDSTHCANIKVVPNPSVPAQDSVIVQAGTEITLNGPSGFATYNWSPTGDHLSCFNCEDPVASPDTTTNFILVVTDDNKCIDSVIYRVVTCDVDRYLEMIPNAFTPNGDGFNDIFRPVPNEGAEMITLLQVYNRWGTKVYEGRGANAGWSGMVDGVPGTSDVYVYIITADCNGFIRKKSGEITLMR